MVSEHMIRASPQVMAPLIDILTGVCSCSEASDDWVCQLSCSFIGLVSLTIVLSFPLKVIGALSHMYVPVSNRYSLLDGANCPKYIPMHAGWEAPQVMGWSITITWI